MMSSLKIKKSKSNPPLTVFLDTSVVLSGLASPTGGSRKLFEAALVKKLNLLVTYLVVEEASRNLEKLDLESSALQKLFEEGILKLKPNPPEELIRKFDTLTKDPDDAHVLSGAVLSGAQALVSLDKKGIVTSTIKKALRPMLVATPKEFWAYLNRKTNAFHTS